MSSAPEAVFLKYGQASEDLFNTMEDLLNNYFTTNHIQRAVIYDVRTQNDQILFDCTLGKYFKVIDKKLPKYKGFSYQPKIYRKIYRSHNYE